MQLHRAVRPAVLVVLTWLMAACGSGVPSGPAASQAGAGGQGGGGAATRLKVMELAPVDDPTISYNSLAQTLGSFQKYGLEVDIQHAGGGGPARVQNVVAGDVDLATTDIVSFNQGVYEGADVKAIIAPGARYGSVIAADNSITRPEELKGKQVAVPSLAGAARFLAGQALKNFGLQDSDIQWLAIPSTQEEIQALAAGRVQGAVLSQTGYPAVTGGPGTGTNIHILIESTAKYTPPWPNFVEIAKSDWAKNNPDTAKKYDLAMLDMLRQVANPQNQQRFAEIGSQMFQGLTVQDASELWKRLNDDNYWGVNGGVNFPADQTVLEIVFQVRNYTPIPRLSKAQDAFDTAPLQAALDQVGLVSGAQDQPDWYHKS
jgi:NitT/TauT family transport system substrate-binding protein